MFDDADVPRLAANYVTRVVTLKYPSMQIVESFRLMRVRPTELVAPRSAYGVPLGPPAILHAYIRKDDALRSIAGSLVE